MQCDTENYLIIGEYLKEQTLWSQTLFGYLLYGQNEENAKMAENIKNKNNELSKQSQETGGPYIAPSQKDNRMEFINWYLEMRLNDE